MALLLGQILRGMKGLGMDQGQCAQQEGRALNRRRQYGIMKFDIRAEPGRGVADERQARG